MRHDEHGTEPVSRSGAKSPSARRAWRGLRKDGARALLANRAFQVVYGLVALFLAYVFASWAIDSGSLLDYTITLLLLFLGVRELAVAIFKKRA